MQIGSTKKPEGLRWFWHDTRAFSAHASASSLVAAFAVDSSQVYPVFAPPRVTDRRRIRGSRKINFL